MFHHRTYSIHYPNETFDLVVYVFNTISNRQFICIYRFILRRFAHSIFHLKLSNNDNDGKIDLFLRYFKIDNFPNLRTLEIYKPYDYNMAEIATKVY